MSVFADLPTFAKKNILCGFVFVSSWRGMIKHIKTNYLSSIMPISNMIWFIQYKPHPLSIFFYCTLLPVWEDALWNKLTRSAVSQWHINCSHNIDSTQMLFLPKSSSLSISPLPQDQWLKSVACLITFIFPGSVAVLAWPHHLSTTTIRNVSHAHEARADTWCRPVSIFASFYRLPATLITLGKKQ